MKKEKVKQMNIAGKTETYLNSNSNTKKERKMTSLEIQFQNMTSLETLRNEEEKDDY